ncbi:histidinol-phosphatase HisJ family protein [Alkalihalobacterium alkalinitrilicum]|uniref:histidinol-phosphatase HisJ family protein n=1 Tax=Alkalihalobacterium alkalinitrilicum TaxID=427920 RepID=UPI000994B660|nr:histidinol-phosphatase HisJ family protein [Alkalihalobacterium alkalinitrilicum]
MDIIDFHIHSNHSFDSNAGMEDVCEAAILKGVKEICFTEHFSLNPVVPTYGHMNFESYFKEIENCRKKYESQLMIKAGIEICEPHQRIEEYKEQLKSFEFDFILGSVHNIDQKKLRIFLENKKSTSAYGEFFAEVYQMICLADIDIIAHLDLLKRYAFNSIGNLNFKECKEQLVAILEKAIARNIGIEINTSGLRGKINESLPSYEILKLYKDLGGEILTIGSDAHTPETVGSHFEEALQMAKECGFNYIYSFKQRTPIAISAY